MFAAASPMRCLPTSVEPVNETIRTRGSARRVSTIGSASPVTTLSTPGGRPASRASSPSARALSGVRLEGLSTTSNRPRSPAPPCERSITDGKFQGVTAPTTPIACRSDPGPASRRWRQEDLPGDPQGIVGRIAEVPARGRDLAERLPDRLALLGRQEACQPLPIAQDDVSERKSRSRRSSAGLARHAGRARSAASIAARVSAVRLVAPRRRLRRVRRCECDGERGLPRPGVALDDADVVHSQCRCRHDRDCRAGGQQAVAEIGEEPRVVRAGRRGRCELNRCRRHPC